MIILPSRTVLFAKEMPEICLVVKALLLIPLAKEQAIDYVEIVISPIPVVKGQVASRVQKVPLQIPRVREIVLHQILPIRRVKGIVPAQLTQILHAQAEKITMAV